MGRFRVSIGWIETSGLGGDLLTDRCTDVQMDERTYRNPTLCSIGHWPIEAAAPKASKMLDFLFFGSDQ